MPINRDEWLTVHYHITCPESGNIESLCRQIALEQTVEVPESCISSKWIQTEIVGQVESIRPLRLQPDQYAVVIRFNPLITAFQIPQFLNLLYGNISLKKNIRIVDISFPKEFSEKFKGPNFGIAGVRQRLGVYERPLAATALKPMGRSPRELAAMAKAFALGGGDIIKDDHGLADHAFCSFRERVESCQAAIQEANAKTGRLTLYFPNVIGRQEELEAQVAFAQAHGVRGILLSPFLIGMDQTRYLAQKYSLVFMAHPAFTGTNFQNEQHGLTPAVLLGTIFRLLGADISVFPNSGGRFGFSDQICQDLKTALTKPWTGIKSSWPGPAGGMNLTSVPRLADQYQTDAVYIIGGALLEQGIDLIQSTQAFMQAIRARFPQFSEQAPDS